MRKRNVLLVALLTILTCACVSTRNSKKDDKVYIAYQNFGIGSKKINFLPVANKCDTILPKEFVCQIVGGDTLQMAIITLTKQMTVADTRLIMSYANLRPATAYELVAFVRQCRKYCKGIEVTAAGQVIYGKGFAQHVSVKGCDISINKQKARKKSLLFTKSTRFLVVKT